MDQRWKSHRPVCQAFFQQGSDIWRPRSLPLLVLSTVFSCRATLFLRKLVLVTPSLKDKKRAVEVVRNIEGDISFYLAMVALVNISIGVLVAATTGIIGISDPLLWSRLLPY
jgi:predicted PurR-regulated permease PerM